MRFPLPILLGFTLAASAPLAAAQSVPDPTIARAVVRCQKAVAKAVRTFTSARMMSTHKCLDAVFACVELTPDDDTCTIKAATRCDKQLLRIEQAGTKLRATMVQACGTAVAPYDVLRSAAALDVDRLGPTCLRFGVDPGDALDDYVECLRRIADCHAADVVEAGTPRAEALLASVGYDLRTVACPTPAPASTATPSAATTPTSTTIGPTAMPTVTTTTTPTPQETATSVTPTPTPTLTATVTASPTPTATPAIFNVAFVTSTLHNGDFGGLAGADALCVARATAAGLPDPASYVAWLSTDTTDAISRIAGARGFVRVDGAPLADEPSDLAANEIWNALQLDELGNDAGSVEVWTGTAKNGTASGTTCGGWTSTSDDGRVGSSHGGPAAWTDAAASRNCSQPRRHYCFGTSKAAALAPTIATGKIAFISIQTIDPSTGDGLASADAMCASEAANAALSGTYKALLATSAAAATSRVTLAAQYVRPDGTLIADGATLAAGGTLASGIWQRPHGVYLASVSDVVWSGATTPSVAGDAASTCGNFASASGAGFFGRATLTDSTWWHDPSTTSSCATPHHVYCLQQ